jgi:hypothetical protein
VDNNNNNNDDDDDLNLYPLIVRCVVEEDRVSFSEIAKFVVKTVGKEVDPNEVFVAISKLIELGIIKLNSDTTGTFSLQDWSD